MFQNNFFSFPKRLVHMAGPEGGKDKITAAELRDNALKDIQAAKDKLEDDSKTEGVNVKSTTGATIQRINAIAKKAAGDIGKHPDANNLVVKDYPEEIFNYAGKIIEEIEGNLSDFEQVHTFTEEWVKVSAALLKNMDTMKSDILFTPGTIADILTVTPPTKLQKKLDVLRVPIGHTILKFRFQTEITEYGKAITTYKENAEKHYESRLNALDPELKKAREQLSRGEIPNVSLLLGIGDSLRDFSELKSQFEKANKNGSLQFLIDKVDKKSAELTDMRAEIFEALSKIPGGTPGNLTEKYADLMVATQQFELLQKEFAKIPHLRKFSKNWLAAEINLGNAETAFNNTAASVLESAKGNHAIAKGSTTPPPPKS